MTNAHFNMLPECVRRLIIQFRFITRDKGERAKKGLQIPQAQIDFCGIKGLHKN